MSQLPPATAPLLQYDRPRTEEVTTAHRRTGRVFFGLAGAVALDYAGVMFQGPPLLRLFSSTSAEIFWGLLWTFGDALLPLGYMAAAVLAGVYIRRGSHVAATTAKWLAICLGVYGLSEIGPRLIELCVAGPAVMMASILESRIHAVTLLADLCLAMFAVIALKHAWKIRPARNAVVANIFRFRTRLAAVYQLALAVPMLSISIFIAGECREILTEMGFSFGPGPALRHQLTFLVGVLVPILFWVAITTLCTPALRRGSLPVVWSMLVLLGWPAIIGGYVAWYFYQDICRWTSDFGGSVWDALNEVFGRARGEFLAPPFRDWPLILLLTILCANSLIRAAFTRRKRG